MTTTRGGPGGAASARKRASFNLLREMTGGT
jgi:hypothetical protein